MNAKDHEIRQIEKLTELLLSGEDLSAELLERMQAWLIDRDQADEKDRALEKYFDRLVEAANSRQYALESWPKLADKLGMDPGLSARPQPAPRPEQSPVRRIWRPNRLIRYAAVGLMCLISIPALMYVGQRVAETRSPFVAETASDTATVWFPDGSRAFMHRNTTISYARDFARNRRVTINGEAYFTVARDERHPFTVKGREVKVTVLGTEFDMRAFDREGVAEVALAAGKVEVVSGRNSVTLRPNQRARINRDKNKIEIVVVNRAELIRAQGENLLLEDVSLDKALSMIGGYFGVSMDVPSDLPAVYGIVLDLDYDASIDDALFLLQAVNPVFDYRVQDASVSITAR